MRAHVSLSLTGSSNDLELLTELAGRAFPDLDPAAAEYRPTRVLHFDVPAELAETCREKKRRAGRLLLGTVVRKLQAPAPSGAVESPKKPAENGERRRPHYFERGA
jgi:hypothetical protein